MFDVGDSVEVGRRYFLWESNMTGGGLLAVAAWPGNNLNSQQAIKCSIKDQLSCSWRDVWTGEERIILSTFYFVVNPSPPPHVRISMKKQLSCSSGEKTSNTDDLCDDIWQFVTVLVKTCKHFLSASPENGQQVGGQVDHSVSIEDRQRLECGRNMIIWSSSTMFGGFMMISGYLTNL